MKIYQYPGNCGAGVLEGIYKDPGKSYIQSLLRNLYKAKVDFSCLTWVTWSQYGDDLQKELEEYGEQVIASEPFYSKHVYSNMRKDFKAYVWCLSREARICLCEGKWTLKKGEKPKDNVASPRPPDHSFSMNVGALYPEGIPQLEPGWTNPNTVKLPEQVAVVEPDPPEAPKRVRRAVSKLVRTVRKRVTVKRKVKK